MIWIVTKKNQSNESDLSQTLNIWHITIHNAMGIISCVTTKEKSILEANESLSLQGASLFSLTVVTLNRAAMLFLPTRVEKVQAAHITTHIRHLAMVILAFVFLKQIVNFIIRFSRTPSLWQAMKCQSTGNSNFHQPDINHASTTYQHMS